MKIILQIIIVFLLATTASADKHDRSQIGEVLGQPVYLEQINALDEGCPSSSMSLYMKLNVLFVRPVLQKYRETHSKELKPSDQEIKQYISYWATVYQPPPDRDSAISAIKPWKLRLHIYKKYGGGRFIVGLMGGIYPFDSKYNWLKEQEKNGLFKITDPVLREALYSYWTSMDHGSNLIDDKTVIDGKKIMEKILNPDWVTGKNIPENPAEPPPLL